MAQNDFKNMAAKGLTKSRQDTDLKADLDAAGTISEALATIAPKLAEASLKRIPPEFIVSTALTVIRGSEQLRKCTPLSVVHAVIQSAQLGLRLDPSLGQAALVPRLNRRTGQYEAQFMPMYRGLMSLVYRSGKIRSITAQGVFEKDDFDYEFGLAPKLRHKPATGDRGPIIGAYAVATLADGSTVFDYMPLDEIYALRDRGGFDPNRPSPWKTDLPAMAQKSVLKRLLKFLPIEDPTVADAVRLDDLATAGMDQGFYVQDGAVRYAQNYQDPDPEDLAEGMVIPPPQLPPPTPDPAPAPVSAPATPTSGSVILTGSGSGEYMLDRLKSELDLVEVPVDAQGNPIRPLDGRQVVQALNGAPVVKVHTPKYAKDAGYRHYRPKVGKLKTQDQAKTLWAEIMALRDAGDMDADDASRLRDAIVAKFTAPKPDQLFDGKGAPTNG